MGNVSGMRAISYGGGVQSTAMVVLAVQGIIQADVGLFANTGDDSEHPKTLAYVRDIMVPWAAGHGFPIHELCKVNKRGAFPGPETLWQRLLRDGSKSLPIPVRGQDTGAPGNRTCTADFKIAVVGKWLREHGATADNPAVTMIGISVDEIERAGRGRDEPHERRVYPLLDLGMTRADCEDVIARAGLPVPPKSSCFFCPYHRPSTWAEMRRDEPDLFDRAQHLEDTLNDRRRQLPCPNSGTAAVVMDRVEDDLDDDLDDDDGWVGYVERRLVDGPAECPACRCQVDVVNGHWVQHHKSLVFLTRFGKRLSDAIPVAQPSLFGAGWDTPGEDGCDEGYCFV